MCLSCAEKLCIAGGMHARGTVEGSHFQAGIIGEAVEVVVFLDIACFLQGVALKGFCRLRNILMAADIGETHYLEAVA